VMNRGSLPQWAAVGSAIGTLYALGALTRAGSKAAMTTRRHVYMVNGIHVDPMNQRLPPISLCAPASRSRPSAVLDLDPQANLASWGERRGSRGKDDGTR